MPISNTGARHDGAVNNPPAVKPEHWDEINAWQATLSSPIRACNVGSSNFNEFRKVILSNTGNSTRPNKRSRHCISARVERFGAGIRKMTTERSPFTSG
jgi:hypothetical protein